MKKVTPFAKKFMLLATVFLECFFGFICFYVVFVLFGMMFSCGEVNPKGDITAYIRSNGVHTDICLPTQTIHKNWLNDFNINDYQDKNPKAFTAIGWGDKGFFLDTPTWAELKASTAFNAIFLPTPTAMHVELLDEPKPAENIRKVKMSHKSYRNLIGFIESTFKWNGKSPILIANKGYGPTDNFYEAHGNYHLFNTCNVWTNNAMKAGSIRTSIFSILPDGNMRHLPE